MAGHTFSNAVRYDWDNTATNVSIYGGYQATNVVGLGSNNATLWPTVLKGDDSSRIISITSVTNGYLVDISMTGGGLNANGGGLYISAAANLLLSQCTVTNNRIKIVGRAIVSETRLAVYLSAATSKMPDQYIPAFSQKSFRHSDNVMSARVTFQTM